MTFIHLKDVRCLKLLFQYSFAFEWSDMSLKWIRTTIFRMQTNLKNKFNCKWWLDFVISWKSAWRITNAIADKENDFYLILSRKTNLVDRAWICSFFLESWQGFYLIMTKSLILSKSFWIYTVIIVKIVHNKCNCQNIIGYKTARLRNCFC